MKRRILGSTRDIPVWPQLDPGHYIDFNPTLFTGADGKSYALIRRNEVPPLPGMASIWALEVGPDLLPCSQPVKIIGLGEDPRAVVSGDHLYVFFARIELGARGEALGSSVVVTQHRALPPFDMQGLFLMPKNPSQREKDERVTWEKNWVPFLAGPGQIAVIYAHAPWEVLLMDVQQPDGVPVLLRSWDGPSLHWSYGAIRGGTTPVPYDEDTLITFFHSSQVVGSRNIYMIGACRFLRHAPYTPIEITPEPLFHGAYGQTAARHGWPILASVLFPLGAVAESDRFRLLTGVDDGEVGVIDVPRQSLEERWTEVPRRASPLVPQDNSQLSEGARRILCFLKLFPDFDGYLLDLTLNSEIPAIDLINNFCGIVTRYTPPSHQLKPMWRRTMPSEMSEVAAQGELGMLLDRPVTLVKVECGADTLARKVLSNKLAVERPMILVENYSDTGAAWLAELLANRGYVNAQRFNLNPEYQFFCQSSHIDLWPHMLG